MPLDAAAAGLVAEAAASAVEPIIAKQRDLIRALQAQMTALEERLASAESRATVVPEDLQRALAEQKAAILAAVPTIKGDPGQDADPADVAARIDLRAISEHLVPEIEKALTALPKPKDGDPGPPPDPEEVRAVIAAEVERAVTALPVLEPGKTPTTDDLLALIRPELAKAVAELPPPEKRDAGPAPTVEQIRAVLEPELERAVAALPPAEPGKPGDAPTTEELRALILPEVQKAVAALPPPERGETGIGLAGAVIDRSGSLVVTMSDGRVHDLGIVVGKDGGDGLPGLGFDDLEITYDGRRTFGFRLARGERVKEYPFKVPLMLDAGVFRDGETYEQGDCVSLGGSMWLAQKDTTEKPGTGDGWRMGIKRGRNGLSPDLDAFVERAIEPLKKHFAAFVRQTIAEQVGKLEQRRGG